MISPPGVQTSSRLVQEMRLGGAVTGDSDLVATRDANGDVELIAVGKAGALYNISRSAGSDTGWQQIALDNGFIAGSIALGNAGTEEYAFVAGINEALPEIHVASRTAGGEWSAWTLIPTGNSGVPEGLGVTKLVSVDSGSGLDLVAVLEAGPASPDAGALSLWSVPWQSPAGGAWQNICDPTSTLVAGARLQTGGYGVLAFQRSETDPTLFDLIHFPLGGGAQQTILAGTNATKMAVANQANGYAGIIVAGNTWSVTEVTLDFIDGSATQPAAMKIPTDGLNGCTDIAAGAAGQTPLGLFALGVDGRLYATFQPGDGPWLSPFELGASLGGIVVAQDSDGVNEVFGFDPTDTLQHLWQDPVGSDPEAWNREAVNLPLDTLQDYPAYSTRLTVRDTLGNIMPNAPVSLYAGEIVPAAVNGIDTVLGPNLPVPVTTDTGGTITIYSATQSLNVAKLRVVAATIDTHVTRNDHSKQTLANATPQEITNLIPPQNQSSAPHVQQAVSALMSAAYQPINTDAGAFQDTIDLNFLPDDFDFRLDVVNGKATFQRLSASDVAMARVTFADAAEPDSWVTFWDWLGDIVESAKNAVESAFTFVVTKVAKGIQVALDLTIRGIRYVFNGVVKLVEDAFSVVSAIFSAVGTFFPKLYHFVGWLITEAAQDIWNTKSVITTAVKQLQPRIDGLIEEGEAKVGAFFDNLTAVVDDGFTTVIDNLGNTTFSGPTAEALSGITPLGNSSLATLQDNSAIANWFTDKLNAPAGATSMAPTVSESLIQQALSLTESLAEEVGTLVEDEFTEFCNYLISVIKDPANFMALTVKEVLLQLKTLIDALLKIAKTLVQGVLGLAQTAFDGFFNDVLMQPLGGDFIGRIYNALNPGAAETPTVLDIIALFAAVPSAVLFRVVMGSAPFTGTDVAEIKASGLSPMDHYRAHGLAKDNPLATQLVNVPALLATLLLIPYWYLEMAGDGYAEFVQSGDSDIDPLTPKKILEHVIGGIGLPLVMLGLAHPTFNWDNEEDTWVNISWISWLGPVAINILFFLGSKFKTTATDTKSGAVLYSISGLIILIFGIVTLTKENAPNFWKGWLNIALPLPTLVKFLLLIKHPVALIVLFAIDTVVDLLSLVAGIRLELFSEQNPDTDKPDT